jgi:hypothetical protein
MYGMDVKVGFASQDFVPDQERALRAAERLADRLKIAHRPAHLARQPVRLSHGFIGYQPELFRQFTPEQLKPYRVREIGGQFYLLEDGPLQQSPFYRFRVRMLEEGREELMGELEATGLRLALHPLMHTFALQFITLHLGGRPFGPFVGEVLSDMDNFPSSEIEVRTGLFGVLVHMQMVEFLAALKREAIPSLCIREPTGYSGNGDVLELMTTLEGAGFGYQRLIETLAIPEDATPQERRELQAFWRLPETEDKELALPDLSGPVGSPPRIAALEEFLFLSGIPLVDIDDLIGRGR